MYHGGNHARPGGNRHADEELLAWLAGVSRLRVHTDVEPRQPARAADEKQKTDEDSGVHHVVAKLRIDRYREHAESPDIRQHAGRDAKRNGIDITSRSEG